MPPSLRAAVAALFMSSVAMAGSAVAAELRVSFGESSLRGEYLQAVGSDAGGSAPTLQGGVLYREEDDADGILGHLGLVIYGDAGARDAIIQVGIGGRVYLASTDVPTGSNTSADANGAALAMGGAVLGRLPEFDRIGAFADIWYSPPVSSFGDLDRVFEINLGVEYQLLRQATVGIGWRHIDFKIDKVSGARDFEDSAFVAFKFLF